MPTNNQNESTNTSNPTWWNDETDASWNAARSDLQTAWNAPESWDTSEPAVRYGYGASKQNSQTVDWDDKVEAKLKEEWADLKSGKTWDEIKSFVRRGWDAARGSQAKNSAKH